MSYPAGSGTARGAQQAARLFSFSLRLCLSSADVLPLYRKELFIGVC
jgi:hypothetical protein